ncbi:beta-phosphoglucomutase [Agarilytica rhodophyticola]|uniref:beta-phosphoglucomutase n=1 Tax=Agarilytica rhodophyticola TaxID=1737490 RepID=UPI000B34537E|nr:beta-phosphoglucomutase [Agarilytica rhodophyticola]
MIDCCIFDLDGVIVDTAKYHFLAWKRLADQLDIVFTEENNELLKGVSRVESLNIILRLADKTLTEEERVSCLERKNTWYLEYIHRLDRSEILPGVEKLITEIRGRGIKIALGSASKNAVIILQQLKLMDMFDVIVDGTQVSQAKPDPEVFLNAAKDVDIDPQKCLVFEDAVAGVEAALNAGMYVIGIGSEETLHQANFVLQDLQNQTLDQLIERL